MTIRVLVVDDQELIRTGFSTILAADPELEVVGQAANGREAINQTRALSPDVVVMDVRMPDMDGIEATSHIAADETIKSRVLILTTFDLDSYIFDAVRAGASGFLLKDCPAQVLRDAVRTVAHGDALLSPSVTRQLIEEFARTPADAAPREFSDLKLLTERELEILMLMTDGKTNAEMATECFVAETTVKTHVSRVLSKLGLRDRVQAVILAYEIGLVTPQKPQGQP
ncbi:MAG: response regulator [Acidimicrobiales bacterium]